ncbi:MAG: hypothetical protein EOO10_22485 [Chitinophagaceae bacterium]|nr:MAG: hypothetical protein EOO10_22485 [Chitinophagaceae bacterium]
MTAYYTKELGKPVIYLQQQAAAHSTSVAGINNYQINYTHTANLRKNLSALLQQLLNRQA